MSSRTSLTVLPPFALTSVSFVEYVTTSRTAPAVISERYLPELLSTVQAQLSSPGGPGEP